MPSFLIADYKSGLQKDKAPWLIMNDAFEELDNLFIYQGRVKKKGGTSALGRMVRTDNLTDRTAGADTYNLAVGDGNLSPGHLVITDGTTTFTDNGTTGFTINGSGTVLGATNYSTGTFNVRFDTGNVGAKVTATYIPAIPRPVMGLLTRELTSINQEELVAFDTKVANTYNSSTKKFQDISTYKDTSARFTWTGDNTNFFWSTNYLNSMWVTNGVAGLQFKVITGITQAAQARITITDHNLVVGAVIYIRDVVGMTEINNMSATVQAVADTNNVDVNINSTGFTAYTSGGTAEYLTGSASGDGIRWYDGTGWVNFSPPLDSPATTYLRGAKFILPFRSRLLCFDTFEGASTGTAIQYRQRIRWSQIGTPYYTTPVPNNQTNDINAWRDDIDGRGDFLDIPTSETITGVAFLKDLVIITCERSTWRLRYSGNFTVPFIIEKINSELGSESGFSLIQFDEGILAIGDKRIVSIDTSNVTPIDSAIPREVYEIKNENVSRFIQGIRDFPNQLVYWTYPTQGKNFSNKSLVYNYENNTFSKFTQSINCFGNYTANTSLAWQDIDTPWEALGISWASSELQKGFPNIVGGNQGGYIFILDNNRSTATAPSIAISGVSAVSGNISTITTSFEHNLEPKSFVRFTGVGGSTELNNQIFKVEATPTAKTFTIQIASLTTYTFGGEIAVLDNFIAKTKRFNPFVEQQQNFRLSSTSFFMDITPSGEFTVKISADATGTAPPLIEKVVRTRAEDLSKDYMSKQERAWHPMYLQMRGDVIQYTFTLNDSQMKNISIVNSGFVLNAISITGRAWNKLRSFT